MRAIETRTRPVVPAVVGVLGYRNLTGGNIEDLGHRVDESAAGIVQPEAKSAAQTLFQAGLQ